MYVIVCPECKARRLVRSKPNLPQNHATGVYCEFCETCRKSKKYRRFFHARTEEQRRRQRERDATEQQREYQRRYNAKWRKH